MLREAFGLCIFILPVSSRPEEPQITSGADDQETCHARANGAYIAIFGQTDGKFRYGRSHPELKKAYHQQLSLRTVDRSTTDDQIRRDPAP